LPVWPVWSAMRRLADHVRTCRSHWSRRINLWTDQRFQSWSRAVRRLAEAIR
jgi:hypothetical protein